MLSEVHAKEIEQSLSGGDARSSTEGIRPTEGTRQNNEDLSIVVEGMNIDLPLDIRMKYFALCRAQKSCLHEKLLVDLDRDFISGVIKTIVKISDKIKDLEISTSDNEIGTMLQMLKSAETVGMEVGFLTDRLIGPLNMNPIHHLESKIKEDTRKLAEERKHLEDVKGNISKLEQEITNTKAEIEASKQI